MPEQDKLQEKVDRAKAIALMASVHNLTPPIQRSTESDNQVAIIDSLKVTPRLIGIFMEIRGLMFVAEKKAYIQVAKPIMNINGAFRFVKILQHIAEEIEWSNFKEEEIDGRIITYFKENFPNFTLWHEDYELDPADFNYISTTMMVFIDSSFHKSKSAKYINAVAKIYSEDFLSKAVGNDQKEQRDSILSKLNPFHKKR